MDNKSFKNIFKIHSFEYAKKHYILLIVLFPIYLFECSIACYSQLGFLLE